MNYSSMPLSRTTCIVVLGLITSLAVSFLAGTDSLGGYETVGSGRIMLILDCVIVIYCILNFRLYVETSTIVYIVYLWIVWMLVISFRLDFTDIMHFVSAVLTLLIWPLIYLFFFGYMRSRFGQLSLLSGFFEYFSVACLVMFFWALQMNQDGLEHGRLTGLNVVYYPLMTLPWVMLYRNTKLRYVTIVLICIAVVCSVKRTALVGSVAGLSVYISLEIRHLIGKWFSKNMILAIALVSGLMIYYSSGIDGIFERIFNRMESSFDDQGSGRISIYIDALARLKHPSIEMLCFGNGHESSIRDLGTTCHNDFLEVAYCYGLVALFLYVCFHALLIRKAYYLYLTKSRYCLAFSVSYAFFLSISMTSHLIIYPSYFVYLVAFWGSIDGVTHDQFRGPRVRSLWSAPSSVAL